MTEERTGGAFLLQELEPKRLVGSLTSVTKETGPGWIFMSFFPGSGGLEFQAHEKQMVLSFDRTMALLFGGVLQVLVAQNRILRADTQEEKQLISKKSGLVAVGGGLGDRKVISCSLSSGTPEIGYQRIDEQIEIRIQEDLAEEIARQLIERMARIAAEGSPPLQIGSAEDPPNTTSKNHD